MSNVKVDVNISFIEKKGANRIDWKQLGKDEALNKIRKLRKPKIAEEEQQ